MNYDKIGIAIIQSLYDDEKQTGKELHDTTIKYIKYSRPFLESNLYDVSTKTELFDVLSEIIKIAKEENKFFFLHFEAHGNNEGIGVKNGEEITWFELLPIFRELNILYKNNLTVHLAVCEGNSLVRAIDPLDRSPFAFIIGSFEPIYNHDILNAFEVFYKNFFNDFDVVNAFQKMKEASQKSDFSIISSWQIIDLVSSMAEKVNDKKRYLEIFDEVFKDSKENEEIIKNYKIEIEKILDESTIKKDYFLMKDL